MPSPPGINCILLVDVAALKNALQSGASLFDEVINRGLSKPFICCSTKVSLRLEKYSPGLNAITALTLGLLFAIFNTNDAEYELPNNITCLLYMPDAKAIAVVISCSAAK